MKCFKIKISTSFLDIQTNNEREGKIPRSEAVKVSRVKFNKAGAAFARIGPKDQNSVPSSLEHIL
jgi:hypothetical protein